MSKPSWSLFLDLYLDLRRLCTEPVKKTLTFSRQTMQFFDGFETILKVFCSVYLLIPVSKALIHPLPTLQHFLISSFTFLLDKKDQRKRLVYPDFLVSCKANIQFGLEQQLQIGISNRVLHFQPYFIFQVAFSILKLCLELQYLFKNIYLFLSVFLTGFSIKQYGKGLFSKVCKLDLMQQEIDVAFVTLRNRNGFLHMYFCTASFLNSFFVSLNL